MKSIIVGTAGHIDHGKTALVKALTGIDADRLQEEKRRGITIDLGFAHLDLPGPNGETIRLGFVDVPGHERFVRNMLAGVGGMDLVLLVIASDEAVMPQTREHLDILQLLGVQRGIVVLTKTDLVDDATLGVVRLEVEEFLRGTFLDHDRGISIFPVSSLTGAGLEDLKRALVEAAAQVRARDSRALARLPVDRVFTMKGFGTVVTGTLVAGTIRREEEMQALPGERRVRVRGVQVHGAAADAAVAGQRTAVNLAGASTEDLSRGVTLAPAATFEPTRRADVKLQLLRSAARPLKHRARVHFHSYTMESVAEIALHDAGQDTGRGTGLAQNVHAQLVPGRECYARIKLPEAALLLPGDRFIIRQFSPVVTIGGGVVLDAAPMPRTAGLEKFLRAMDSGDAAQILSQRIARRAGNGISLSKLIAETGWTKAAIESGLAPLLQSNQVIRAGDLFLDAAALAALQARVLSVAADFHKKNPLAAGISREQLRALAEASAAVFDVAASALVSGKKLEIAGELARLPGQGVVMKDEEAESKQKIEDAFAAAGVKVPALNEVMAGLKVDKPRAQKIVTLLLRDKVLVKVSDELVFHRKTLEQLRRQIAAYKTTSSKIDVAKFKDLFGVTRKYAIPLLEYLDRERVTRRVGDERIIL